MTVTAEAAAVLELLARHYPRYVQARSIVRHLGGASDEVSAALASLMRDGHVARRVVRPPPGAPRHPVEVYAATMDGLEALAEP